MDCVFWLGYIRIACYAAMSMRVLSFKIAKYLMTLHSIETDVHLNNGGYHLCIMSYSAFYSLINYLS